jgi:uncharacterized paraquat-inducible protein A
MPYLRCPNCGLLAHVVATGHTAVTHCPRCRARQQQQHRLTPVEESLEHLSAPHEPRLKPSR